MKILIAVDMEGISGVTSWDHVHPGHAEYFRFRHVMTADVNAAVLGAFAGGASEVIIADGHWNSGNVLVEELDSRAHISTGTPSPFSMVNGIDGSVSAVFFVGYHARAGTQHAILDHTWSNKLVMNVWLNGELTGETGLNAAVCGHFGAPVMLVTGDQSVCAEARSLLGDLETVEVKQASGRFAADCLPPAVAQKMIEEAAARAAQRVAAGAVTAPYRPAEPVTLRVELHYSDMADRAMLLPGIQRLDGRTIEFASPDMPTAYWTFRAAMMAGRE